MNYSQKIPGNKQTGILREELNLLEDGLCGIGLGFLLPLLYEAVQQTRLAAIR